MKNKFELFPEAASSYAGQFDVFYIFMVCLTLFWTALISAAIFYFAVKYRRRSQLDKPKEIHGNNKLEIAWTILPLIIALGIFFWAAHIFFVVSKPPPDAMEILVTGKQWMWKIQHPSGKREINTLTVPEGQAIKLTMTSEDVVHSFFIPAFRVKQDVVPGKYTRLWFEATKLGEYRLFCAEYCGTEHSKMGGWVNVVSAAKYQDFVSGGTSDKSPVDAGKELFASLGCSACHNDTPLAQGPNMVGVYGTMQKIKGGGEVMADEDYIRESILNPNKDTVEGYQPIMPPFQGLINETQLMQLVAYIKSIGKGDE